MAMFFFIMFFFWCETGRQLPAPAILPQPHPRQGNHPSCLEESRAVAGAVSVMIPETFRPHGAIYPVSAKDTNIPRPSGASVFRCHRPGCPILQAVMESCPESVFLNHPMPYLMRKIILFLFACLIFRFPVRSQAVPEWNAAKIKLQMEKLDVLGSVLYVAAHPDDENTRLLAWLSNAKKYRTGYLSLTRGDGGQNLVGDEQGAYLGLMRTEELLAARHTDGAEQFFSHAL